MNNSDRRRTNDLNLKHFQIRIRAKFCVGLICILQAITRIIALCTDSTMTYHSKLFLTISLPFDLMIPAVIAFEYFLFKTKGPHIVKYSGIFDMILLLSFMADWITSQISDLYRVNYTNPPSFKLGALFGFTAYSWRTLIVTLIVQKWQLKIIAPSLAIVVATAYAIHYSPANLGMTLMRSILQLFYIILILYCEDKMKWKLMWTNIQQEKWMQVNDFILNNIPENIMILDLKGELKFVSEYCKSFIEKCNLDIGGLNNIKEFFMKIRDLHEQKETTSEAPVSPSHIIHMERLTTGNELLGENEHEKKVEILADFINNFTRIIKDKNLKERQFLVYNGKLKIENHQDKSIEVKISFVQHFENDYIILIFRDTTQRDLLVTLEETNKYKDQLLASVSHELRAPLNGNINLVESAVNSKKIPEDVKDSLLIPALRSSKFLLHIINDILDMSQIKEKKLRLVFQSDDLKETLKSTAQLVELQARKKCIELKLDLDHELPKNFCTDHLRLSQIVLNLLTNAIKFTTEGMVKLTAVPAEKSSSWYRISVEDSGIGISSDNLHKLFSNYTHIEFEGRQMMNPAGVGLGLNIAHNLAELLGPRGHQGIVVESCPNKGSTFYFIIESKMNSPLKLELEDIQDEAGNSSLSSEVAKELSGNPKPETFQMPMFFSKFKTLASSSSLPFEVIKPSESQSELLLDMCSCPKVLIVDDNPFNTMALETILGSLEIKCDSVYSGSACIQKLLNRQSKACCKECKPYSVVFMDQEMPDMNGVETVNEIKILQKEEMIPSMKIIGCTAHKAKEEVDKFLASGLDQCIYKPVSIVMIKETLKEVLSLGGEGDD